MAGSLKVFGLERELKPFRKRVLRQLALGRIYKADADKLTDLVDQIEAHVLNMREGRERRDFTI